MPAALEASDPYDALVTNVRLLAGPTGWTLGERARELRPSIAVLYVSGGSAIAHQSQGVEGSMVLAKPFLSEDLCGIVASLLDRAKLARREPAQCEPAGVLSQARSGQT